jgi:carbonic anhydrase
MNPGRDFVCPPPLPGGIYNANDEALNAWLPADTYPQFFAYNGSLTTHTATVKAFRVLSLGVL